MRPKTCRIHYLSSVSSITNTQEPGGAMYCLSHLQVTGGLICNVFLWTIRKPSVDLREFASGSRRSCAPTTLNGLPGYRHTFSGRPLRTPLRIPIEESC